MRRALVINARLLSRCSCQLLYCTYQASTTHPRQHHHPNTLPSAIQPKHSREHTNTTRSWTFTKTRSLNGDGERSRYYKHRHHELANIHTRAKISLASEAPAAHLVRPVTTTRRETRRTSRSTSRRHSQPPVSAARRESKPALLPQRNYLQSTQPQDAS